MSILDLAADFSTKKNKKSYEDAMKKAVATSVIFQLLFQNNTQMSPKVEHPLHKTRLLEFVKTIDKLPQGDLTINFGDSLTDLSRVWLSDSIDGIYSVAGSWANHMAQMAREMRPYLQSRINDIKYVVVGTLGGNPMLVYQNYQDVINESYSALNEIKANFPNAKIIVYSIPPTYNVFANTHAYQFSLDLAKWVNANNNSCLIDLHSQLGNGPFNLFPSSEWSSDGIHLSPKGARKLSSLINFAKKTNQKIIT